MLQDNLLRLEDELRRLRREGIPNRIAGKDVFAFSGEIFENRSPVDGSLICEVAKGGAEDVGAAAQAAREAFPGWRDTSVSERRRILHGVAERILSCAEKISLCECWDTGQPLRYMSKAAQRGAENFTFFADRAESALAPEELPSADVTSLASAEPIGPVGVISAWNTPFALATWKLAPALAAGCTAVLKPAERAPVTARMLASLLEEAGMPPGVVNVVNGTGEEAGRALTEHPDIRAIAFVGDSATGSRIMAQGAATLKRLHFELGGKNPVVVFDDADFDRALDAVVFMIFSLNGERCTSSSRLLVQDTIADEFEARLAERVRKVQVGHPLDPATEVGPMAYPEHYEKVTGYLDLAREEGATVAAGGAGFEKDGGLYVRPTLLTDARPDMRIAQEEIFGPVLASIRFGSEEEALEIANGVRYGLTGYVWTGDPARGKRVAQRLDAGRVWVNSENVRHLAAPYSGWKASGPGLDGGDRSFDFCTEIKSVGFPAGRREIPKLGV